MMHDYSNKIFQLVMQQEENKILKIKWYKIYNSGRIEGKLVLIHTGWSGKASQNSKLSTTKKNTKKTKTPQGDLEVGSSKWDFQGFSE